MPEQKANSAAQQTAMTWARRADTPAFSPAPGIQVQPVIGKSLMTCWITMEPGAVVVEHSHPNEQLGVVVEGSVTITVGDETREMVVGDAYVVPPDLCTAASPGRRACSWWRPSCRSGRSTPRPGEPSPGDDRCTSRCLITVPSGTIRDWSGSPGRRLPLVSSPSQKG